MAIIGRVRMTKDLDLWVEPTAANARRVVSALADFGFPELATRVDEFATPDRMAVLGREPLRIDIMTSITGVTFATAWRGRTSAVLGGHKVSVLGRAAFLRNKRATGRPHDLADVALLEEADASVKR